METFCLSPEFLPFWGRLIDVSVDGIEEDSGLPATNLNIAASASLVADLPSVLLSEENDAIINDVCSICMDSFDGGDRSAKRVPCGHVYHGGCIATWLSRSDSCPLCRCEVSSSPGQ